MSEEKMKPWDFVEGVAREVGRMVEGAMKSNAGRWECAVKDCSEIVAASSGELHVVTESKGVTGMTLTLYCEGHIVALKARVLAGGTVNTPNGSSGNGGLLN